MSESFNAAEGRPVIGADDAETVGKVKGFIVDPSASRIEAIHVSGRGKHAEIISWSSIKTFGNDAVMADSSHSSEEVSGARDTAAVKGKVVLRGSRVLTTTGFLAGAVEDVRFAPESGELTEILTDQGSLDIARVCALGSYALVVSPDA